ncbi:coatomer subunit beta [Trichinella spiralis]|uniref:coatomer subunit beta n=1 Tax=Trichinella spiralis TaxID=6334 RepID=UPI0001EFB743|nr:coatomer subunit beta [Trichinella spiralis]
MKQFMTSLQILVTLLLLYRPLQCIEESNSLGGNRRLAIELLSHKPCRKGRWDERIRFPSSRIAELVPDPKKEFGCYKIRGEVEVFKEIQGMNELFSLQVDGERFDCDRGIDKGTYNSIEWHFCTPTLDEFLENADIDPDFWSKHGNKGQIIFQTIQIYNVTLNTLPPAKLQKVLNSGDGMIACHKLVVNYLQDG